MIWQRSYELVDVVVIHCSGSPNGLDLPITEIDRWHQVRAGLLHPSEVDAKFAKDAPQPPVDIQARAEDARARHKPELLAFAYHFLIHPTGQIESGRRLDEIGSHCRGINHNSIGVCLLGKDKFSVAAWATLKANVESLRTNFSGPKPLTIIGHTDRPGVDKICPGFDTRSWLERGMVPLPANVI